MINLSLFDKLERPFFYTSLIASVVFFALGLYFSFVSPADYQQSDFVRIMYVHVPSAWMALGIYILMGSCSIIYIIWRNQFLDIIANQAAVIGAGFALITLVTGAFWGQPVWGTWWVWDARLTSMLILFFFYLGYIALFNSVRDDLVKSDAPAILAIVGLVNIPIIKFSVDIWATLHQPASVFRSGGPAIHSDMLLPLMLMFMGSVAFFCFILILRIRSEIIRKKILRIRYISSS
ncbi:MAG: heme ABC transporter permease CcmC [Alphaproteobacteria bacterium]|nr:heme ABC transporter permease CcmC [Alphaproteobacteria bacterium]